MRFWISREVIEKEHLEINEALVLVSFYFEKPVYDNRILDSLKRKGYMQNNNTLSSNAVSFVEELFLNSEYIENKDRFTKLANKLREIYPQGKKEGSSKYFRGNTKDVTSKLKKFFKLYGDKYSDEEIINATKKYVDSFNGDYTYMRILDYFILKHQRNIDEDGNGYIQDISELASILENKDANNNNSNFNNLIN